MTAMKADASPASHAPDHAANYEADYIIVGGGSAGCVLAARLSEDARISVLLIEAGGEDRNPLIHIPAGYIKTMVNPAMNWMFETEPEATSGNRRIKTPRGKVLGGSSAINAMLYVRGQSADYDEWAQRGNPGWGYADVLEYFRKAENAEFATDDDPYHARGGPLNVATLRNRYAGLDKVMEAAAICGYASDVDYNGASQDGFSYYQVTQKNGMRFSAKKAYLDAARRRPNLRVLTGAHVTAIECSGNSDHPVAMGVRFQRQGKTASAKNANAQNGDAPTFSARAGHEVILAAGAIQSPQILELSGIGNPEILAMHGIAVTADNKGVGENLADHYISRLSWQLSSPLSVNAQAHGIGLVGAVLRYAMTRRGVLSMPAGMLAGFVRSRDGLAGPDIQYHIANASFANPEKRVFDTFPGMTFGPCQLRPESRGTVHIASSDAFSAPLIRPNYLSTDEDCRVHVAGMRIARQIMESDVMAPHVLQELKPGADAKSDADLLAYARETGVTLYHPVSTCRMGPAPENGDVVDARLRVHGVRKLRVVDASVMPTLISGNTNAPTIMIAEKAADMIKADRTEEAAR